MDYPVASVRKAALGAVNLAGLLELSARRQRGEVNQTPRTDGKFAHAVGAVGIGHLGQSLGVGQRRLPAVTKPGHHRTARRDDESVGDQRTDPARQKIHEVEHMRAGIAHNSRRGERAIRAPHVGGQGIAIDVDMLAGLEKLDLADLARGDDLSGQIMHRISL